MGWNPINFTDPTGMIFGIDDAIFVVIITYVTTNVTRGFGDALEFALGGARSPRR